MNMRASNSDTTDSDYRWRVPHERDSEQARDTEASAPVPTSLLSERIGDGQANCLEYAARVAGPDDEIIFLDDIFDSDRNGAGHVLVRDKKTGGVWDPVADSAPKDSFDWPYESVEQWNMAQRTPKCGPDRYAVAGVAGATDIQALLALPPEERANAIDKLDNDTIDHLADMRVAGTGNAKDRGIFGTHWDAWFGSPGGLPEGPLFQPGTPADTPDEIASTVELEMSATGALTPGTISRINASREAVRMTDGYIVPQSDLDKDVPFNTNAAAALAASAMYNSASQPPTRPGDRTGISSPDGTFYHAYRPEDFGIESTNDKVTIFKADSRTAKNRFIVGFRGSVDGEDWANNIVQGAGLDQTSLSAATQAAGEVRLNYHENARKVALQIKNSSIPGLSDAVFTGHSLGGGLATTAHLVTGNETFAYNPADLSRNSIWQALRVAVPGTTYDGVPASMFSTQGVNTAIDRSTKEGSGLNTIVAENDILDSRVNRLAGGYNDLGHKYVVASNPAISPTEEGGTLGGNGVKAHGMPNVFGGLASIYQQAFGPYYEGAPDWKTPHTWVPQPTRIPDPTDPTQNNFYGETW